MSCTLHRTRSTFLVATAVSVAFALGSCGAFAAPPPPAPASAAGATDLPAYDALDADKDGIVTLPEVVVYSPSLAARIAHCDSNGDKRLSKKEYAACRPKPAAEPKAAAPARR